MNTHLPGLSDYDPGVDNNLWYICKIKKFLGKYAVFQYVNQLFIYLFIHKVGKRHAM